MCMIVAWTGHRPDLFRDPPAARAMVHSTAHELVQSEGATSFLVGGQRGVDTWAALAAIALGVPFTLLLPLPVADFTADWFADDRMLLERSMAHATDVRVVGSGEPALGYSERNRQLATQADLLVAVWTGVPGGGTAETIAFARAVGTPVREILLEAEPHADSKRGRGI
jgi:hypothetical protein